MKEDIDEFVQKIPSITEKKPAVLIDYFVYFITVILKEDAATPAGVERCFELVRIQKYSNISSYLSRKSKRSKSAAPKFIKTKVGYQLERGAELEIQKILHIGPARQETSHLLRGLLTKVSGQHKRAFLQESIDCYEIGAKRASVVMVWILTINHLYEYIFYNQRSTFDCALSKNNDKRVKVTKISKVDDFSEIPEGKFIELARSAGIISNDIRKILDVKLGVRNSYAHPSNVTISDVKATDFIIDLVENVILKYEV
ncbi:hypothetical protein SAMN05421509_105273 [Chromohalobacter canadensis]|uniref:RiboL-PSP-HEPN domain-containing protein n=1 Tax=Chromohalobacter canadensis TaxID=141389 RepID=A0A285VQ42_9GAMM|nr:hypothetical protein [Chromohalobacter canadensis]SOC55698.1 hypothetical protein SAMN05421509_105273 [Chromohalobacter canadensis]